MLQSSRRLSQRILSSPKTLRCSDPLLRLFSTDSSTSDSGPVDANGPGDSRTARPAAPGGARPKKYQKRPAYSARYKDRHGTDKIRNGEGGDSKMRTIKRVVPMSEDLKALYETVLKGDAKALAKYKYVGTNTNMRDEDMMLLADAIEFYFSMAPSPASGVDGVRPAERNALKALGKILRAHKGSSGRDSAIPKGLPISSPLEKIVVNTAPPGRLPWQVLGVNEELATVWWGVDLTGGKAKDPWSNGRLSQEAKNIMYEAYKSDPEKYNPGKLAAIFRIREQRALAIVRLKELEEKERKEGGEADSIGDTVARVMERALRCTQGMGSDEKHHVELPSFPAYAQLNKDQVISALEEVLQKNITDIDISEITEDVAKQVLGTKSLAEMEEIVAAREERHLVKEFRDRLDYNLGITGQTISRESRRTKAPSRPDEGWSLVVTPLGKQSKMKHERFVAMPDGTRRPLNADELLYVDRKTPKPRRKIL
jgi:hypothetical protein